MLGHSQTKMVDTTVNKVWLYSMNYKHAHVPFLDLRDLQVKCSLMEEHGRLDRGLEQTISTVYDRAKKANLLWILTRQTWCVKIMWLMWFNEFRKVVHFWTLECDAVTLTPTNLSPANYASIGRCELCNIWSKVHFLMFEIIPRILQCMGEVFT